MDPAKVPLFIYVCTPDGIIEILFTIIIYKFPLLTFLSDFDSCFLLRTQKNNPLNHRHLHRSHHHYHPNHLHCNQHHHLRHARHYYQIVNNNFSISNRFLMIAEGDGAVVVEKDYLKLWRYRM